MFDRSALKIGRRVVVFTTDRASGATLGYYGTIVGGLAREQLSDGSYSDFHYLVRVGSSVRRVAGDDLLPTNDFDATIADQRRNLEIRYESEPQELNQQIQGSFTIGSNDVGYFRFRKAPQPLLTYQLHIPTAFSRSGATILDVSVPDHEVLDKTLVLEVLTDVLVGKAPTS